MKVSSGNSLCRQTALYALEYTAGGDENALRPQQFSKWFQRYRKHVEVERIISRKNRVDFHSFRYSFEDAVRNLPDVKQEVRDALQGYGENGVSAQYGTGVYRKTLHEAMKQVSYDGDLSHLVLRR